MLSATGSSRIRVLAAIVLASIALGMAPGSSTCGGPGSGACHDRDPATDHDGKDPDRGSCAGR